MALSGDLRMRVEEAVIESGLSRNAAAERFGVSVASAVRWVKRFETTGEISPARTGGDRRSDRIEAHRDYLLGFHSPRAGHDAAGDTGAPGRQLRRTFLFIRAVALFRSLQHHI